MSVYNGLDLYPTGFDRPDDGDDIDAASVNVGFEALADRATWLKLRGARSLNRVSFESADATISGQTGITTVHPSFSTRAAFNLAVLHPVTGQPYDLAIGDLLLITVHAGYNFTAGTSGGFARVLVTERYDVAPTTYNPTGGRVKFTGTSGSFAITTVHDVNAAGKLRVSLELAVKTSGSLDLVDAATLSVLHLRHNQT